MKKRILSLVLTLAVMCSAFASFSFSVNAESKVTLVSSSSSTDWATITSGMVNGSIVSQDPDVASYQDYDGDGTFEKTAESGGLTTNTNPVSSYPDFSLTHDCNATVSGDMKGLSFIKNVQLDTDLAPTSHTFTDGTRYYVNIVNTLDEGTVPSDIVVSLGSAGSSYGIGAYDLYASDSLSTLFDVENRLYSHSTSDKAIITQRYSFNGDFGKGIKYVAIRIIKCSKEDVTANNYPRIREFNVFGYRPIIVATDYTVTNYSTSSDSSLPSNFATDDVVANSLIEGKTPAIKKLVDGKVSEGPGTSCFTDSEMNEINHGIGGYAIDTNSDTFPDEILNDESKFYAEYTFELDGKANISTLSFLLNKSGLTADSKNTTKWAPEHIRYYFGDSKLSLYSNPAKVIDIDNNQFAYFHVNLNTPFAANFVGIRIICPSQSDVSLFSNTSVGALYPRITYMGVYGSYCTPAKDKDSNGITAKYNTEISGIGNITETVTPSGVNDSNGYYPAGEVSLEVPCASYVDVSSGKMYEFDGWYLNSQKVSSNLKIEKIDATETHEYIAAYNVSEPSYIVTVLNKNGAEAGVVKVNKATGKVSEANVEEFNNIAKNCSEVYGYNKKMNGENYVFSIDVALNATVTADISITLLYEAQSTEYAVTVTDASGKELLKTNAKFDQKISLNSYSSDVWNINGSVVKASEVFVCGNMNIVACMNTASKVAFIGSGLNGGIYGLFVKSETNNITEQGVFITTFYYYESTGITDWADDSSKYVVKAAASTVKADYMVNINGYDQAREYTAVAYIKDSSGNYYYSDVYIF